MADEKQPSSEVPTPIDGAAVVAALNNLRDEQAKLRVKIEGAFKEGGAITKLTNGLLEVQREMGEAGPKIEKRFDVLEAKVHPVSKVEKAVLIFGAVAITNLCLRLISGTSALPVQHGVSTRSVLETLSYLVSP